MDGALGNQTIIKRPKTPRADGNQERGRRERGGKKQENEIVEGIEKKVEGAGKGDWWEGENGKKRGENFDWQGRDEKKKKANDEQKWKGEEEADRKQKWKVG